MFNPNPSLYDLESQIENLVSACEDLTAQRDELLTELKTCINALYHSDASLAYPNLIDNAQAVIARCEASNLNMQTATTATP